MHTLLYFVTTLWISGLTQCDQTAHPHSNGTADTPDLRSPVGFRVPPYQTAGGLAPAGPAGFLPQHVRIEGWAHHPSYKQDPKVVSDYDNMDEDGGCMHICNKQSFSCQISCTCISMDKRCDGHIDCEEEEDEAGCSRSCDETHNKTICHTTNVCIDINWLCDGDNDCGDFSDETHCGPDEVCTSDQVQCANGLCIHKSWLCDGDNDCRDNSDETNCTRKQCRDDQFMCEMGECISGFWRCDKTADCPDNSDELECPPDIIHCSEHQYQCDNKLCIDKKFRCDGDNDCGDWSDEDTCDMTPGKCNDGEFKCSDGKCIPERWLCDTERDCSDGGDELNCEPHGAKRNCSADEVACHDRKCILKSWLCDGNRDCSDGEDERNCTVKCEEDQYTCKPQDNVISHAFRDCLYKKHVCDGIKDCPKGDDEDNCPTRRSCSSKDKCEKICLTTADGRPACDCPRGYVLNDDKFSCRDIDECMYEQDPVCSQTCSNSVGSFTCGCMTGYVLRPDGRTCKPTGESPTLLFSNIVGIRQIWLTGDNYVAVVKGLHNAVALDYHYEKKLLFWTENNLRAIRSYDLTTNNITDVVKWGLETPSGIAIDWIHDLIFWTDSGTRRVEVTTLDGRLRYVVAANDLDKPRAIAVHPGDALVFWTDWGPNPKIERSDMDGTMRKSVIVDNIRWPNGLTIDYVDSKIYWVDAKHHIIERATFDGRQRKKITSVGLPHPFALTIFEDAIYWTDWHTKSIATVNKYTGRGIQTVHSGLNKPMDIQSFHSSRQQNYRNRCARNNGGCSHLCLPNSNDYSCICPVGFNLNSDGRNCDETPDKLILFSRNRDIRLKQLYPRKPIHSIDMVIPIDHVKSAAALDWDQYTNTILWTDTERDTINRAYLNGSYQTVLISNNLISPSGLAFDWVTNKIYWSDSGSNRIEVANWDGSMRTLLAWANIDQPRDIVLDPKGGLMYWSDWGKSPRIERADMDGNNRKTIVSGRMTWPNGIALDLTNNRIYWADGGNRTIEYSNLDGTGRAILISDGLPHPFALDLYGDEVFWTDFVSHSIQAANKLTGKNRRTIGSGLPGLTDVKIYHKDRKSIMTPCGRSNGGCSHLCLLKPGGRTCACPIGIKINSDNRTCPNGPVNFLIFAHRVDIRIISLDVPYLADVVLPLKITLKNALGVDVDLKTGIVYWTDTAEKKISCATRSGSYNNTIIDKGLLTADAIVVDSNSRKLYWTDGGRNSVEVSELDGSNRKVLIWTKLDSPRAIALHYELGYMFWGDWGATAKIERADMDGRNRKVVIDNDIVWPNGLAIDKIEGRIYWNDAKVLRIDSSDFEGRSRRAIIMDVQYPYGIVIVGQHIYWTDWRTESLNRADKSNGRGKQIIRSNLQGLMSIKAVQGETDLENACGTNNGGCSHLCLRVPHGYRCACPTGIEFENKTDPNAKICKKHPDNFLVFATRTGVAMISMDTPEQWDVTLPLKNIQNSIAIDFHWDRKEIFFSDVTSNVIRSINMLNMNESKVIIKDRLDTPNGLAVDWIANNIYWTDNEFKVIEVARIDGTSRKTLIQGLNEPRALAIFPAKGYLYWTDWGENPSIERCYLDGTSIKSIVTKDLGFPNGLTIDYKQRKLYWTDALKNRIDTSDLDGNHRYQLVPEAKNPFGMTQFNDFIFWTNWSNKSVMRADKHTGRNVTTVRSELDMAMEIKAVSEGKQRGWNPCREDNGGCSHLCLFKVHDYVCACPDEADSTPCSLEPSSRVDTKLPLHYPRDFDYKDDGFDQYGPYEWPTKAPPSSSLTIIYVIVGCIICLILAVAVIVYFFVRRQRGRHWDRKENVRDASGHISFPNPNYAAGGGGDPTDRDRRLNRFQGIFKYDKSQERVTNVYLSEGASLLPPPPPPPLPPHRQRPRDAIDDFEPVTLHSLA